MDGENGAKCTRFMQNALADRPRALRGRRQTGSLLLSRRAIRSEIAHTRDRRTRAAASVAPRLTRWKSVRAPLTPEPRIV